MTNAILLGIGPCSMVPGGRLNGDVATEVPEDWSFVNELGTCALETRPADPHSVTVICFSNAGTLYVGSMGAPAKRWPEYVLEDPRVRYRAGERIYELRATLVENEDERRAAFRARHRLDGEELAADVEVPDHYWIFGLEARGRGSDDGAGRDRSTASARPA